MKECIIGDEYIKNLSNTLKTFESDTFQFAVMVVMTTLRTDPSYPTNVSIGFAIFHEGDEVDRVKYQADEALYYSKSHGKSTVASYEEIKLSNSSISLMSNDGVIAKYFEFGNKSLQGVLHVDEFGSILNANDCFLKMVECSSVKEVNPNRVNKDFIALEHEGDVFKATRIIKGQEFMFSEQYLMFDDTNQEHRFIIALIKKRTD